MDAKRRRLAFRAPFLFFVFVVPATTSIARDALEQFEAEELKYLGSASGHSKQLWGTVEDPVGYRHAVKVGSYLGWHEGRVSRVTPCRIYFIELKSDGAGGWIEVYRSIHSSSDRCDSVPRIATDVAYRDPSLVPQEVEDKIGKAVLSEMGIQKRTETSDLVVWNVYPMFACDNRPSCIGKLVIFHKKSHAVEIIAYP